MPQYILYIYRSALSLLLYTTNYVNISVNSCYTQQKMESEGGGGGGWGDQSLKHCPTMVQDFLSRHSLIIFIVYYLCLASFFPLFSFPLFFLFLLRLAFSVGYFLLVRSSPNTCKEYLPCACCWVTSGGCGMTIPGPWGTSMWYSSN